MTTPTPRNPEQQYLQGIWDRLDRQNGLLADIRDRLPAPSEGQPVTDQAANAPGCGQPEEVEITEPATPPAPGKAAPLVEPDPPTKRPPAKKPTARKAATGKKQPATVKTAKTTPTKATRPAEARSAAPKGNT
jgi:hypothetical protein